MEGTKKPCKGKSAIIQIFGHTQTDLCSMFDFIVTLGQHNNNRHCKLFLTWFGGNCSGSNSKCHAATTDNIGVNFYLHVKIDRLAVANCGLRKCRNAHKINKNKHYLIVYVHDEL